MTDAACPQARKSEALALAASSDCGPFYSSADQTVYIDLSFFTSMKRRIGADGDFAYAYVIAHEVGHHVQYLPGTLQEAHSPRPTLSCSLIRG